jgi:hypothetical protein
VAAGDRLESLFAWGNKVFTVKYVIGGESFISYRTTFEMMLNSLKLVGVPVIAAPQDATTGPGSLTSGTDAGAPSSTVPFVSTSSSFSAVSSSSSTVFTPPSVAPTSSSFVSASSSQL